MVLASLILHGLIGVQFEQCRSTLDDVLFDNGPFLTHRDGGYKNAARSEVDNDPAYQTLSLGLSCYAGLKHRLADDFAVPKGSRFEVKAVQFQIYEAYQPKPDITSVHLKIWKGRPTETRKALFDKTIFRRSISMSTTKTYRLYNSQKADVSDRLIYTLRTVLPNPIDLEPGSYWLDWSINSKSAEVSTEAFNKGLRNSAPGLPVSVMVTEVGWPAKIPANGLQHNPEKGGWNPIQMGKASITQDLCFQILGKKK